MALGWKLAHELHNTGCWIDPEGEVDVWQAALIEFTSVFILLCVAFPFDQSLSDPSDIVVFYPRFLAYGVGLDPRQAKVFGAKYGPVLVGLTVGLM